MAHFCDETSSGHADASWHGNGPGRVGILTRVSSKLAHLTVVLLERSRLMVAALSFNRSGHGSLSIRMNRNSKKFFAPFLAALFFLSAAGTLTAQAASDVPVFKVTPGESNVTFDVEASVAIKGTFKKWESTLTFKSPDVTTATLFIKIDAA